MTFRDGLMLGLGAGSLLTALMIPAAVVLTRHAVRRYDARLAATR